MFGCTFFSTPGSFSSSFALKMMMISARRFYLQTTTLSRDTGKGIPKVKGGKQSRVALDFMEKVIYVG